MFLMIRKSDDQEVVLKRSHKKMSKMTDKEQNQAISEAIIIYDSINLY